MLYYHAQNVLTMIHHFDKFDITILIILPVNLLDERNTNMGLQITGIRKPNPSDPHTAISLYRWRKDANNQTGIDTRDDVINYLVGNRETAYVSVSGSTITCMIRENQYGTKYLETRPDNTGKDNLLALEQV